MKEYYVPDQKRIIVGRVLYLKLAMEIGLHHQNFSDFWSATVANSFLMTRSLGLCTERFTAVDL